MSEIVLLKNPLTGDSIQFVDGILRARIEFRSLSKEDFDKEMVDFKDFSDEEISEQEAEALAKFLSVINDTLGVNIQAGDFSKNSIGFTDTKSSILNNCINAKPSNEDILNELKKVSSTRSKKTVFQRLKDFFRKK